MIDLSHNICHICFSSFLLVFSVQYLCSSITEFGLEILWDSCMCECVFLCFYMCFLWSYSDSFPSDSFPSVWFILYKFGFFWSYFLLLVFRTLCFLRKGGKDMEFNQGNVERILEDGVKEKIIRMQFMKNSIFNKRKNKRFLYGEKMTNNQHSVW